MKLLHALPFVWLYCLTIAAFTPPPQGLADPADVQAALTDATANLEAALGAYDQAQAAYAAAQADSAFATQALDAQNYIYNQALQAYKQAYANFNQAYADSINSHADYLNAYNRAQADSSNAFWPYTVARSDSANASFNYLNQLSYFNNTVLNRYNTLHNFVAAHADALNNAINDSISKAQALELALFNCQETPTHPSNGDAVIAADANVLYLNTRTLVETLYSVGSRLNQILSLLLTHEFDNALPRYNQSTFYYLFDQAHYATSPAYFSHISGSLPPYIQPSYLANLHTLINQDATPDDKSKAAQFIRLSIDSPLSPESRAAEAAAQADAFLSQAQSFPRNGDSARIYTLLAYSYRATALGIATSALAITPSPSPANYALYLSVHDDFTLLDNTFTLASSALQAIDTVYQAFIYAQYFVDYLGNSIPFTDRRRINDDLSYIHNACDAAYDAAHILDSLYNIIPFNLSDNNPLKFHDPDAYYDFLHARFDFNPYLTTPNPIDLTRSYYTTNLALLDISSYARDGFDITHFADADLDLSDLDHQLNAFIADTLNAFNAYNTALVAIDEPRTTYAYATQTAINAFDAFVSATAVSATAVSAAREYAQATYDVLTNAPNDPDLYPACTTAIQNAYYAYHASNYAQAQLIEAQAAYDLALAAYNALPTPPAPPDATLPVTGAGGAPVYYTLSGRAVSAPLKAGLYIVKGEGKVRKVVVK